MWGNRLGWSVSVLIVLLVGTWVYLIERGSAMTPPTEFSRNPANFEPLRLPAPPASVFKATSDADAGPMYRQAIEWCRAERGTFTNFVERGTLSAPERANVVEMLQPIVDAAACTRMDLFASRPDELVSYAGNKPSLDALETIGRACVDRLGLLHMRAGNRDEAEKYFKAGFALGLHLARERVTYGELDLGLQLLGKAAPMLAKLADESNNPVAAAAWRDFDQQRLAFATSLDPTLRVVRSIDPRTVGRQSGDVFELAKRSKERMWRVEAMLALGRLRHFAGEGGTAANQRAANAFLGDAAASESDPIVRAAAVSAHDVTVEQHRAQ
jgi:hypothetical protein